MHQPTVAIILPCFNEEAALPLLLKELDTTLARLKERCMIVVVDDGSTDDTQERVQTIRSSVSNVPVELISLPYTMGHQSAIYQGLLYASGTSATRFIVMDGDGEDDPAAIPEMLEHGESIVFVARGKRSESAGFKLGYLLYRALFRIVAGRSIGYGNFSMIDRRVLSAVLDQGFVHYAAFLSKRPVASATIRSDRRERLAGVSKMGLNDLGLHAFRSLIEYSDRLLALFLKAFLYLGLVFLILVITIVCIKLFTSLAIPGWASTLSATMFNSMLLCLGFFVIGLILSRTIKHDERGKQRYSRSE